MAIASKDFLWYKRKDLIQKVDEQHIEYWSKLGFIKLEPLESQEEIEEEVIGIKKPKDPSLVEKIKDFAEDVLDDGKRNYSNRKNKSAKKKK